MRARLIVVEFASLVALAAVTQVAYAGGIGQLAPALPRETVPEDNGQLDEEDDADGDNEDLEVVVRHHPGRRPQAELMLRRRRRTEAATVAGDTAFQGDSPQYRAATALDQPVQSPGSPTGQQDRSPVRPGAAAGTAPGFEASRARGLDLMIGILIGVLFSLLLLVAWRCWPQLKAQAQSATPAAATPPPDSLDGGRLGLVQFHYQGAFFNQLSWTFERGGGARDREGDYVTMVLNERSQKVARGVGRLMSTPNGEMYLTLGAAAGGMWCILKRPAPSRRPGQLWDFKVCKPNGVPYSEVRQRSETKCLVNDAVTQRRMMTVIGNFTYPVFLSGERSIHVWITQADGQSCMGAQCEAKLEDADQGAQHRGLVPAGEGALPSPPSRRFYVTTTANTDASLVLAVLLGLQDVHRAARRSEMPAESSSASTGTGWPAGRGRGTRISSGGSTAATSAAASREPHFESAKAAPTPP